MNIQNFNHAEVEEKIGYTFKKKELLEQAFTRSSYAEENFGAHDNEVLEFIGDTVIGNVVVKKLIKRYQRSYKYAKETASGFEFWEFFGCEYDEGELSKLKIGLVQRSSLAAATDRLELGQYLRMGKGDIANKVGEQASVKEDLLEAIVGAVAIDSDWDSELLEALVVRLIDIDKIFEEGNEDEEDYEQALQKWSRHYRGHFSEFEDVPPINDFKYGVKVNLGIGMLNHDAYGYGNTERGARRMASKRALDFILEVESMAKTVFDTIGEPNLDQSVNQLQELYQKKIISEPKYTFTKCGVSDSGNTIWTCECSIEGFYESGVGYECSSKKEAKKLIAYDALGYLVGTNFKTIFLKYGKITEKNKNSKEEN